MNATSIGTGLALLLLAGAPLAGLAQGAASAAASAAAHDVAKAAGDACEEAVDETVHRLRGKDIQEVHFIGAQRAFAPTQGDETGVKGEGRYKANNGATVSFTYSCAYNTKTREASGVVLSEKGAHVVQDKPWQPDLTNLSPEACERGAAVALKNKYPRVGRIVFDSDSRRLSPGAEEHTVLQGQGAVERAPGMHSIAFTYRCEVDTHSGKVLGMQIID